MSDTTDIYNNVKEYAKELDPNIAFDKRINWILVMGFTSRETAVKFTMYCFRNYLEVSSPSDGLTPGTYNIRFR